MSGTIIISYRESDVPEIALRLRDRLETFGYHCGFMSESRGAHGRDYPAGREDMIAACDGFVAMIGPRWLMRYDERGQPGIHHRDDFTRKDISAALVRDVPILVVLADGMTMPLPALLPADLLLLAYQPATELRGAQFDQDVEKVVMALRRLAPAGP
jgi:hypothetical protein